MKIKIMDLLHKIYNLDNMPKKIIFENCVWRYCSEFQDYQSERGYLFGDYMCNINETRKFLNNEVEIIDDKKIEYPLMHKIGPDEITGDKAPNEWYLLNCNFVNLNRAVWQLIDAVNKLQSKG